MLDFLIVANRSPRRGDIEIYPKFIINNKSSDLMIRGGDFYAIWNEEKGLWSTDEQEAVFLIDRELDAYYEKHKLDLGHNAHILHMWDAESGMIDCWHKYCQKQLRDSFVMLDERLSFTNDKPNKKDYVSKRLPYPLEQGDISAYDQLIGTLYIPAERHKIEWAIGAIVSGDSKTIQKFMVLYGSAGTGKSTILNIIQDLFEGYYTVFDAKALGSANNAFALESFTDNPLIAIEHDGDLSRIEDNTRLNSLVSHEMMTVNEKFKKSYANRFKCFLFMGTNKPVKITDAKSGLIRRLIDVAPSGDKLPTKVYNDLVHKAKFELGGIAKHCLDVYLDDKYAYDAYIPVNMLGASNDFYNFVLDSYSVFHKENGATLSAAWEMYKNYCDDAKVQYPFSKRVFKEELRNYFDDYSERVSLEDGSRLRSYYKGFKTEKFEDPIIGTSGEPTETVKGMVLDASESLLDRVLADFPAQYGSANDIPLKPWNEITSVVSDLDTRKLHFINISDNHIVIDFDMKDEFGKKSLAKNLEAASKWPPTYAELSKSGCGVHLHYYYTGDVNKLSRIYDSDIEIKVFTGNSALRRKLTKCNDLPIASLSSGLPLKGEDKVINHKAVTSERKLRELILRNLNKEFMPGTKSSIDLINKMLNDAYASGMKYDVNDMRRSIFNFGSNSTNNADYCTKLVMTMKFNSDETSIAVKNDDADIVFFDVEVFPNLFLIVWKRAGKENPCNIMINPKPKDIEPLLDFRLIGFNCRRYDNHMAYGCYIGYSNEMLYKLSQQIISGAKNCMFGEAYNISYTDIYDFASAGNKKSLKKLEIEMGIHHQELGLPWDKPVPEELWIKVGEYCVNDVLATEAAFEYLSADWLARQILADLAEMTVNDTTNTLTGKIIFGNNKKPQSKFRWRNMALPVHDLDEPMLAFLNDACPKMMQQTHGPEESLLPYFPGYKYEFGKSTYLGEVAGEGGFVDAKPGIYGNVALLDIVSMHPHSGIAECMFGPEFTAAFRDIVEGRVSIKNEAWDVVDKILDGKLTPYVQKVLRGELKAKQLANALKTAINSVYGLTSAKFDNLFRNPNNIDNMMAKRGALFMIGLKYFVLDKGFEVAHIKTDSIKIPDATPEIITAVKEYARLYGYEFDHEATYDKMCLVNDAVYIAKYASAEKCEALYGYCPGDNKDHPCTWTATGTQFAVPYVFKTLFSKEEIVFDDFCETNSSMSAIYLDMNETLEDVSKYEKELDKIKKADVQRNFKEIGEISFGDRADELEQLIAKGHNYIFIGKIGQFCPIRPGFNGGVLYREKDGKYYALGGTKGYRWLESENLRDLNKPEIIDRSYYDEQVKDAAEAIGNYGGLEWFCSDKPYDRYDNDIIPF